MVGSVLSVTDSDLWTLTVVVIVVLACIILFYRHLKLVAFDPVMAAAIGVPVLAVDYLLTGCTSLVVVWGVGIVGVVLVVALIVTPAATAYLIHDRLDRMLLTAVVVSIVSVNERNPMPRLSKSSTVSMSCFSERASRSSFHTTSVSPSRM